MEANNLVNLKHKQEKAVNGLSGGRDVFAVTATGYGLTFYSSAVWNCSDDQENSHRATVRYCSVSDLSIKQHNSGSGKGGKITWLRLCCNSICHQFIQHMHANIKHGCYLHTGTTKSFHMQFAIVLVDVFLNFYWPII